MGTAGAIYGLPLAGTPSIFPRDEELTEEISRHSKTGLQTEALCLKRGYDSAHIAFLVLKDYDYFRQTIKAVKEKADGQICDFADAFADGGLGVDGSVLGCRVTRGTGHHSVFCLQGDQTRGYLEGLL
jgi:hypothetical protein